jgi:hypothetical protein
MRADLRTGVGTFSSLTGLRDAIAPIGTRPSQRMWVVLLISTGGLSSHHLASSIYGSLAPCFNSTLFGDTMAAAWVQKNARGDGFPSSQFGQINSPKRNTLETAFSLIKLPLKFSDQRRKSKRSIPGKNRGELPSGPLGPVGRAGRPTLFRGPVRSCLPCTALFSHSEPMRKRWPSKSSRETPKNKRKTIYKNQHLVLRPRLDVRALLPW